MTKKHPSALWPVVLVFTGLVATGTLLSRCSSSSGLPAATQIALTGTTTPNVGNCVRFAIDGRDAAGNPATLPASGTAALSGAGMGAFYTDAACTTIMTSIEVPDGAVSASVYYKNNYPQKGLTFGATVTGLGAAQLAVTSNGRIKRLLNSWSSSGICALLEGGAVYCWPGSEYFNTLQGGTLRQGIPVPMEGYSDVFNDLSFGVGFSCAAMTSGGVRCSGRGDAGELGNGASTSSFSSVPVSTLTGNYLSVGTGFYTACAVAADYSVKCWGNGTNGELGQGFYTNSPTPVDVVTLGGAAYSIVSGSNHSCAVVGNGVRCWGYGVSGQLGNNGNVTSNVPVSAAITRSASLSNLVAGGSFNCALVNNAVQCWGDGGNGQLGDNGGVSRNHPVAVDAPSLGGYVTAIAAGYNHACALISGGTVKCWGANTKGELGDTSTSQRNVPVAVQGLTRPAVSIGAGMSISCAVLDDYETVQCWGFQTNANGTDAHTAVTMPSHYVSGTPTSLAAFAVQGANAGYCFPLSIYPINPDGGLSSFVTADTTVNVTKTLGAVLYSDAACTSTTSTATILNGTNAGHIYVKDPSNETTSIGLSATGLTTPPATNLDIVFAGC